VVPKVDAELPTINKEMPMDKCDFSRNGKKWWSGSFHYECQATENRWQTVLIDCRTPLGVPIGIGKTVMEGKCEHTCVKVATGGLFAGVNCADNSSDMAPTGGVDKVNKLPETSLSIDEAGESMTKNEVDNSKMAGCSMGAKDKTWWSGNFQYKCTVTETSWSADLVACRTTKGTVITRDAEITEDSCLYKCSTKAENNGLVLDVKCDSIMTKPDVSTPKETVETTTSGDIMPPRPPPPPPVTDNTAETTTVASTGSTTTEEPGTANCDMGKDGNTWWVDDFRMRCTVDNSEWKSVVADCRTPDMKTVLAAGSSVTEGECTYTCAVDGEGLRLDKQCVDPTTGDNAATVSRCNVSSDGLTWWEGNWQHKCTVTTNADGRYSWKDAVVDCRTKSGTVVGVGKQVVENGCTTKCYKEGEDKLNMSTNGTC
jgi:hypothetical protein